MSGVAALAMSGVGIAAAQDGPQLPDVTGLSGEIRIDGSSTVFPVSEAIAEEFQDYTGGAVRVTVAESGTSGGFQKFCRGETDINDASRPIKEEEVAACAELGIEAIELPVAYDGLSVVVHADNDWVDCLTVGELNRIWDSGSTVTSWAQVRDGFPDRPIAGHLYGAGADSGTFDYFTEEINGETDRIRTDFTQSEDDNVLVQGVSTDPDSMGFFGYAYYAANPDILKVLAIDGGNGCVTPTFETIADGSYTPLSRPIFVYPSRAALDRPEVAAFVQYYLATVNDILGLDVAAGEVAYVPLDEETATIARDNLAAALTE
jgi:phosphate transport system substrate-binding protein